MSGLIKREDAAEAIYEALRTPLPNYNNDFFHDSMSIAIAMANNIPSAGPDRKFLEIIAEYPKIYTYPEYEGKPYYSIKYEENGETIIGFGTYKPEVLSQYLKDYFISSAESERKRGKWQRRKGSDCWECSQCHAVLENDDLGMHNFYFCYHCGANMMNRSGYMDIEEVHYG